MIRLPIPPRFEPETYAFVGDGALWIVDYAALAVDFDSVQGDYRASAESLILG